ncbi:MAG: GNAT family N-acetyltransferase [Actinomycetota bacterium]
MHEPPQVTFSTHLQGVDWRQLKATLAEDRFDNGRTPEQLRDSFENSAHIALAWAEGEVIGTARALSDGVCNAYVVDVWTHTPYRRQGVATRMMRLLLEALPGQHVHLFSNDAAVFYKKLGFQEQPIGLSLVVGEWLIATPPGNSPSACGSEGAF